MSTRKRILVIEDDDAIRELIQDTLEIEGYQIHTASNGLQGLAAVVAELPDLILLDWRLPMLSGEDFMREYSERAIPRVPVVVLTGLGSAVQPVDDFSPYGILNKPFDLDQLISVVENCFTTNTHPS